jgi:predicted acetyltransferase
VKVEVRPAEPEEALIVANLMNLYLYEFSDVDGRDIGEDARFHYGALPAYWIEEGRYPFLIWVDSRLAGSALVAERRIFEPGAPGHEMVEFFVLRKYRRRHVGEQAAWQLFDRFPGPGWVPQHHANGAAHAFWRAVIGGYTCGQYREEVWTEEGTAPGIVHIFDAPGL